MDTEKVAAGFNEWMREFTEEPEKFKRQWTSVRQFLRESEAGKTPTYGQECAAALSRYMEQLAVPRPPSEPPEMV